MKARVNFRLVFPVFMLWSLAVVCLTEAVVAAEAEWKVGLARVKITPQEPLFMAGYASRNKPFEGIEGELYAKAMAFEDREGHRAVIVTSDLIGFTAKVAEPICEQISAKTGLQRAQVLLNSSHTHTGPTLNPGANQPSADAQRTEAYTCRLQEQVVALVEQALSRLEPANLEWGVGVVNFPMNRREFTPNGVILGVNPRGPVDRSVPVLRVAAPDGKLRAVLFGATCHNTTLGGRDYKISGDFSGYSQDHVETQNPGAQAMFMQGCAGDANPHPKGTYEIAREHGATLGREVLRVLGERLVPVRGPLRVVYDLADLPLQSGFSRADVEKMINTKGQSWRAYTAGKMLEALDKGEKLPTHYRAPIAVWQFGNDLTLVGLSGEVVVDFVALTEQALGPLKLWIAAYCNDVYGYLPSARVLEEGGYETRGLYAGGIGFFAPTAQDVVAAKLKELAEKTERSGMPRR